MKVRYDPDVDVLTIELRDGTIAESDETRPGLILDLDDAGRVLAIEILDASSRVDDVDSVSLRVGEAGGRKPAAAE